MGTSKLGGVDDVIDAGIKFAIVDIFLYRTRKKVRGL